MSEHKPCCTYMTAPRPPKPGGLATALHYPTRPCPACWLSCSAATWACGRVQPGRIGPQRAWRLCKPSLWALQGLDWRDPAVPACNAGLNPIQEGFYDGINVNPLEVLFIKVGRGWHPYLAVRQGWEPCRMHSWPSTSMHPCCDMRQLMLVASVAKMEVVRSAKTEFIPAHCM